jgi:osmotically-inducible protein OsmY
MAANMDNVPGACLTAVIAALSAAPMVSCAQTGSTPSGYSRARADSDAELAARVQAALDADPYFYAEHTEVTVEHGAVVLTGIVWDNRAMFDAIDDAKKAAPGRKIINHLSLVKISAH